MIVYDDNTTQSRTVCYSKLDLGDERSHDTIGAVFDDHLLDTFANFQSDMDVAQTRQMDRRTPHHVVSAPICSVGHGYGPFALWTCKTFVRERTQKVKVFPRGDCQLEI